WKEDAVGAADQAGQQRAAVLDAAIVVQEARARALDQALEQRHLVGAPADIEKRQAGKVERVIAAVRLRQRREVTFGNVELLQGALMGLPVDRVRLLLRGELARALSAALARRGLGGEPRVEIANEPVARRSIVRLCRGVVGALRGPPRQHVVEAADGLVPRREAVLQLPLLALQLASERRIVLLELAQAADVGAVGGADQMREHVHVAEGALDDVLGRLRMRQRRPIGAWNIALPERLVPQRQHGGGVPRFGEARNRRTVTAVERLLQELG